MNLQKKRLFLLDMDGTLYLGDSLFAGVADFLDYIRSSGGRYLFLTNNSSKSASAYVEKLHRLGLATSESDFLTSVDALVHRLEKDALSARHFYVCGTASLREHLRQKGFFITENRDEADALLCGFDTELSFQKLEDSCILLNRDVPFFATNPDWVCPTWYGAVPDCGSVCEMLFRATGRRPIVVGKPEPEMALLAMARTGYSPAQTLLIGDRIYTDIACGLAAGVDAALVLSGESTLTTVEESAVKPTAIYASVSEILGKLRGGAAK